MNYSTPTMQFEMFEALSSLHLQRTSLRDFLTSMRSVYDIVGWPVVAQRIRLLRERDLVILERNLRERNQTALSSYRYCLLTSVCLHVIASMSRIETAVVLGAVKDAGKFHSHAWIEILRNGRVIDPTGQHSLYKKIGSFTIHDLEGLP